MTPSSTENSTETAKCKHHRRKKVPSVASETTQSESLYNSDDYDEEQQSQSITNDQYTESETITTTPNPQVSSVESIGESNTVDAPISSPNLPTPTPLSTYVNIAPLPIFHGNSGECPISHLSRFSKVCRANNAVSTEMVTRIFPVTLDGEAGLWYELNVEPYPSLSWEEIKSSFVKTYQRTEFVDQFRSELMMIKQGGCESINAYYLRMQWILKKWPDHGIPDIMLKGFFIDGLREDFQDWIIPQKPNSLDEALKLALTWEQAQSIRAARHRNLASGIRISDELRKVKCGFCDGSHEEQDCGIRNKLKELWVRSKEKAPVSSPECKNFRSLSPMISFIRREDKDEREGSVLGWKRKSQCQCWKHQCWKKNEGTLEKSNSILPRNSTVD